MEDLDQQLGLDTIDTLSINNSNEGKRSTFLTVLCILAFIGNGLSFIQGGFTILMAKVYSLMFNGLANVIDAKGKVVNVANNIFNALTITGITIVVCSIICVLGAIFMWKMKKSGFYLYLSGQVLSLLSAYYFLMVLMQVPGKSFVLFYIFLVSVFPIAFLIMFGLNYKNLK